MKHFTELHRFPIEAVISDYSRILGKAHEATLQELLMYWNMKHDAVNPYTHQPLDIKNAIPHSNLRLQMHQYILDNPTLSLTLDLEVIPNYTKFLGNRDMKDLLNELVFNYRNLLDYDSPSLNLDEAVKKYWKNLRQKLNLLRLYCQYSEENKETFLSIKGYENLFQVVNEPLHSLFLEHYPSCEYAMEVCIEIAKIVDVISLRGRDRISIPNNCVHTFARILYDLSESKYLKIKSMDLRIFLRLFYAGIIYNLGYSNVLPRYVIEIAQYILWRQNSKDITNEDLYNGMAILSIAWTKNELVVLNITYYVDLLVNVVINCINHLQDLNIEVVEDLSEVDGSIANETSKPHLCLLFISTSMTLPNLRNSSSRSTFRVTVERRPT